MKVAKVNAFIASMHPPPGEALKTYLSAAVRALGGRADADLARTMGVPASTVAAWKRRGAIPESHYTWFTTTLSTKILEFKSKAYADDDIPLAAALNLLARTGHNPWGLQTKVAMLTAPYILRELTPLAGFLHDSQPSRWEGLASAEIVDQLTDLLEGAVRIDVRLFKLPAALRTL